MKAHKISVTIPEDHLEGTSGEQVIGESQGQMLKALQKLQSVQRTPEEERILDEFEEFQRQYPIDFSSLSEEE